MNKWANTIMFIGMGFLLIQQQRQRQILLQQQSLLQQQQATFIQRTGELARFNKLEADIDELVRQLKFNQNIWINNKPATISVHCITTIPNIEQRLQAITSSVLVNTINTDRVREKLKSLRRLSVCS